KGRGFMKSSLLLCGMLAIVFGASGCGFSATPVFAGVTANVRANAVGGYIDNSVQPVKRGQAEAKSYLFVAVGAASIKSAMQNGGITKVHHVETETVNALGFYSRLRVIVYGE